jgi:cellulose synthase/poly-beta-1,6-N-acetylglucosamine synthase-like glycosyltransferase
MIMNETGRITLQLLFWACLAATAYTYFLYPLLLAVIEHLVRQRRQQADEGVATAANLPTVTIVVSAFNEEASLSAKIANCQAMDYPYEKLTFMIGSDGSTDGTNSILRTIRDSRFQTVIVENRSGKTEMLNRLMQQVDSAIVVFSDANTMYEPDAIRRLVVPFADGRVGCVIGKQILYAPDSHSCGTESLYWRYENWIKQRENVLGAVPSVNGSIFAIRRELYEPMPPGTITDDQVLGLRIMAAGWRGVFEPAAVAWEPVSTMADELRRRIRISAGNFQSMFLATRILNPMCGRVHFAFVSHKLLRWLVPMFLAGMLASNVLLAGEPFYGAALLMQGAFYGLGLLGLLMPNLAGILKVLAIPKYFLAMNAAILIGLIRFLRGRQQVTWFRAARRG